MQNSPEAPHFSSVVPFVGHLSELQILKPEWEVTIAEVITGGDTVIDHPPSVQVTFRLPLDASHPLYRNIHHLYTLIYCSINFRQDVAIVKENHRAEMALHESLLLTFQELGTSIDQTLMCDGIGYATLHLHSSRFRHPQTLSTTSHRNLSERQRRIALLIDLLKVAQQARSGVIDHGVTPGDHPSKGGQP